MRRSQVNHIIREFEDFARERKFFLPRFAFWNVEDWAAKGDGVGEILESGLGWDITDWGMGDFSRAGLALFTIRNGTRAGLASGKGKLYAEKLMTALPNQVTPMHYHAFKMEDIVNRGGGDLAVQLYAKADDGSLGDADVSASIDGVRRTFRAGEIVTLSPGDSITIHQGLYHKFWGVGSRVLLGEVSLCNDDDADNFFYEEIGRFPSIEEDEAPKRLLVKDYPHYLRAKDPGGAAYAGAGRSE